jgi:hypothetical protein
MKNTTMTLKPGLLVSLKTTMRGGVEYVREDISDKKEGVTKVQEWKTVKRVANIKEYEAASKLRSKLGGLIRKVCVPSAFGLICPVSKEQELRDAIAEAKEAAARFNTKNATVSIGIYTLVGRIAETDQEAMRAIKDELKDMLAEMQRAIQGGAIEDAREAASKLLKMGMVLDEQTQGKVKRAVEEVRQIAKEAIKKVAEGGVTTAQAVANIKFTALEEARFAFLDEGETIAPVSTLPATDVRGLDADDVAEVDETARKADDLGVDKSSDDMKAAAPTTDERFLDA